MPTGSIRASDVLLFIVDDDGDARANLRDILELDGYTIAEASSAEALFDLPDWDKVSLILLDRKLPDRTPELVLAEIVQKAPLASVIIITGNADIDSAITALRHGAVDYIVKPINADALRASIQRELVHQNSERQLRALYENTLTGLLIFDRNEIILDANPATCDMLKLSREALVGRSLTSLGADYQPSTSNGSEEYDGSADSRVDDDAGSTPGGHAVGSTGGTLHGSTVSIAVDSCPILIRVQFAKERKLRRGDSAIIDVEQQSMLNFSPGLNALSLRDVTEKRQSEVRALQSERLAAIGETMTALVHESRNALQRSFACLEMLALEVEDRPVALDLVLRTQRAQNQLRDLYEEVRQWAAPLNLRRDRTNLSQVWREAWNQVVQSMTDKKIRLVEELSCEPLCRVDAAKMNQVFRNIFENAVEVAPGGSAVTLRCDQSSASGRNDLHVSVHDQGPGLTLEQRARMFEPFFTTKSKGTGLGMAIAKRIIASHHGHIHADSSHGACIEITLPRGMT